MIKILNLQKSIVFPLSILLFGFFLLSPISFSAYAQEEPEDFRGKLHLAYEYGDFGDFNGAKERFEKLLETNPEEFIVYDLYAQTLENYGLHAEAIKIYEAGLPYNTIPSDRPGNPTDIRNKIGLLHSKMEFAQNIRSRLSEFKDREYEIGRYKIKTNVPEEISEKIIGKFDYYLADVSALLEEIFGKPVNTKAKFTLNIFGTRHDYLEFREKLKVREVTLEFLVVKIHIAYIPGINEFYIYYDGEMDEFELVSSLTEFLLVESYAKKPSALLRLGISQYVGYKLAKRSARRYLLDTLELMNWFYDQGWWDNVFGTFSTWGSLERIGRKMDRTPQDYMIFRDDLISFKLYSWTLIDYFIEGADSYFKGFFKKYLEAEVAGKIRGARNAYDYFDEHLTQEKKNEINNEWADFCLKLSYNNI